MFIILGVDHLCFVAWQFHYCQSVYHASNICCTFSHRVVRRLTLDPKMAGDAHPLKKNWQTDWSKCCLCQQDKNESLMSPKSNPALRSDDGYSQLAKIIPRFQSLNQMPMNFDPVRLDDGNGIESTLRGRGARYHNSCRLQFNTSRLKRAEKRTAPVEEADDGNNNKVQRKSGPKNAMECFLCEQEGGDLREASTVKLNNRLNDCARNLSDVKLLAKLSAGDAIAQELKYHPRCLAALYNRERARFTAQQKEEGHQESSTYAIAFSELVTYITESKASSGDSSHPPVFKLSCIMDIFLI